MAQPKGTGVRAIAVYFQRRCHSWPSTLEILSARFTTARTWIRSQYDVNALLRQFTHAEWNGFNLADANLPAVVVLMVASMVLSYRRHGGNGMTSSLLK
jgi:hypothetical protein